MENTNKPPKKHKKFYLSPGLPSLVTTFFFKQANFFLCESISTSHGTESKKKRDLSFFMSTFKYEESAQLQLLDYCGNQNKKAKYMIPPSTPFSKVCKNCKQLKPLAQFVSRTAAAKLTQCCESCRCKHRLASNKRYENRKKTAIKQHQEIYTPTKQVCARCFRVKPMDQFQKKKSSDFASNCISCRKDREAIDIARRQRWKEALYTAGRVRCEMCLQHRSFSDFEDVETSAHSRRRNLGPCRSCRFPSQNEVETETISASASPLLPASSVAQELTPSMSNLEWIDSALLG
jgi:hypothetical protein